MILGLLALVGNAPDAALPAEIAAGLPQLLSGLVRLLMDLKAQQDRAAEAEDDEEEPDEEVGQALHGLQMLLLCCCYGRILRAQVFCTVRLLMDLKAQQDRAAEADDDEEEPDEEVSRTSYVTIVDVVEG
jgi:hypothetical protein